MSATMTAPILADDEQRLVLHRLKWAQDVTIADALPDWRGMRMTFIDGRLSFLTTSRRHDWYAERMGQLVVAVAHACGIAWDAAGTATFRLEALDAVVEGDKTFYFGASAERMQGPQDIDLTTQPPPDLAIEVEVTHAADDAVAAWGRLGVPEIWRFDARRWTLGFWGRREDGSYAEVARSLGLPLLEPKDVLDQLRMADELRASRWFAQLDGWARDALSPRRGV